MSTHLWWIRFTKRSNDALQKMSKQERAHIFAHLPELLNRQNPLAHHKVEKVVDSDKRNCPPLYKLVFYGKGGGKRVFFELMSEEVTICGFKYLGIVLVTEIRDRDEHTYKRL